MIDLGYADFLTTYELTVNFTLGGASFLGAISDRTDSKNLAFGGMDTETDQTLVCPLAQFGTLPVEKETVVVDGKTMRIESIKHSPDGKFLVLNLNDPTRGI